MYKISTTLVFALLTCFLGKAQTDEDTLKSHRLEFAVGANLNTVFGPKYIEPVSVGGVDLDYRFLSGYSYENSLSKLFNVTYSYHFYKDWSVGIGIQTFQRRTIIGGNIDSIIKYHPTNIDPYKRVEMNDYSVEVLLQVEGLYKNFRYGLNCAVPFFLVNNQEGHQVSGIKTKELKVTNPTLSKIYPGLHFTYILPVLQERISIRGQCDLRSPTNYDFSFTGCFILYEK